MVHTSLNYTYRGADDLSLLSYAVKHYVWLYNRLLNKELGLTTLEFLTRSKSDYRNILRYHVWGCPVFFLEPKQQNDQNIPKWNQRARLGQFIGFSDLHSSLMPNVQHLSTRYISPQFHLVFDDLFETVICQGYNYIKIESIYSYIFDINRYWYVIEYFYNPVNLIYWTPPLHDVWLDDMGRHNHKQRLVQQQNSTEY